MQIGSDMGIPFKEGHHFDNDSLASYNYSLAFWVLQTFELEALPTDYFSHEKEFAKFKEYIESKRNPAFIESYKPQPRFLKEVLNKILQNEFSAESLVVLEEVIVCGLPEIKHQAGILVGQVALITAQRKTPHLRATDELIRTIRSKVAREVVRAGTAPSLQKLCCNALTKMEYRQVDARISLKDIRRMRRS